MATPGEKKALGLIGLTLLLGVGARLVGSAPAREGENPALDRQIQAVESARGARHTPFRPYADHQKGGTAHFGVHSGGIGHNATGLVANPVRLIESHFAPLTAADPLIDIDTASASTLDRLPGIGPTLARRIVADRDSLGPFGSLEGLQRVRGVGARLVERLKTRVTFSGMPRPRTIREPLL